MTGEHDITALIGALGFRKDLTGNIWSRTFVSGFMLEVDVANGKFLYEKAGITVTTETTSNFAQPENFVVFECVCRLLEKGYKPKDLELEPRWQVGRGVSGGRADIWVRTKTKGGGLDSLLIIECKTPGREFDSAWRDTKEDGAQLFSYFQQEGSTKFLCLYTSDLVDGKIKSDYFLINVQDNPDYLKTLKKPKTYEAAKKGNEKDLFAVWRDTYKLEAATLGLFEPDIAPYKPGKNKYSVADLREIDHVSMQKKYNEFATILRQFNVSGHENAFDKLVNLFLAKVVDEKRNAADLKFYWKGIAYDDAYSLQDRLQYLYMVGMREFLGETVTYIDEATVKKAFGRFEKDPDATKDAILRYFRQLKFFSNNDFSFIDVHNERLFNENAAILLKIVQMLEDVKLKTDEPNQFLGDLFEGFLDRGVKQSEGQFFTPLPIVRFIVSSLPIQNLLREAKEPPRVIDYACGAGHFLNEYAQEVKRIAREMYGADAAEEKAHYSAIVGIEKEYRLSKVAKVAAFMYGEDDIQIVYADALARHQKAPEGSFDLLVANPPYSVKGFLETLSEEERNRYELTTLASNPAKLNSIEAFFVERAVQLLKPTGIAAIILPSSILSNGGGVYVKCREIILENFDIVAIAEFGSGTFGKTGTNTITAFLRKKDSPPDFADHWRNRVDAWFAANHVGDEVFCDASALERYCAHRKFDLAEYKAFLAAKNAESAESLLWNTDAFKSYRAAFAKTKKPKKATEEDIARLEAEFIRSQEKERLYYFLLADANPVPVLVIKMPSETKAAKSFLGYEWSAAKGNEGIKYIGVAGGTRSGAAEEEDDDDTLSRNRGIEGIKTPLFDNSNLFHEEKLNSLVRYNFNGSLSHIPESLQPFARRISLVDMLDFEATAFDKQFRTGVAASAAPIQSNFPMVKLGDVAEIVRGVTFDKGDQVIDETGNVVLTADNITLDGRFQIEKKIFLREGVDLPDEKRLKACDSFMCFASGSKTHVGKVCFIPEDTNYFAGGFMGILRPNATIASRYLPEILNATQIRTIVKQRSTGTNIQNLSNSISSLTIPLPPLAIQRKVVDECAAVDAECAAAEKSISAAKSQIASIMADVHAANWPQKRISEITTELQYGTSEKSIPAGKVAVVRMGNIKDGLIDWSDLVFSDNESDIAKYLLRPNDVLFNRTNSPEHVGKAGLYRGERPAIFAGYLIRVKCKQEMVNSVFLVHMLNSEKIRQYGFSVMSKSINQANIGANKLSTYMIPLPPLAEQERIVRLVEAEEAKISESKGVLAAAAGRKQGILRENGVVL